ncbi:uncharacterized protein LOC117646834 isoform X2 [Thrips palmi]|uniref:Uncharacterized protein LOC117646834 isoform X2 n=1 Tax=Thrips palmi TaxID=161013 RepID=A0A6P8Z1V6_THRPL|nr:uncharacterized protein LOC117646834 isoform X2 [Thrips palmi]
MEMREKLREREFRVRKSAAKAGLKLSTPPCTSMYHFDQAFLQAKKDCMEACLDQIVRWMHIVEIDPMLRLRMHQAMVDADYGRREELRLIEQLKQKESIISVWEKSLEAHKAAAAKAAVAAKA